MAGKDHIKASFDQIYELGKFSKNILIEIFGTNKADIFGKDRQEDESNKLSASEKKVIQKVLYYGNLTLDDSSTLKLYEITLKTKVRIEQSKVAIQQYVRKNLLSGEGALVNFINPDDKNTWRLTLVACDAVLTEKGITNKKLNAKRYTFIVGASEQNKTITDRFAELEKASKIVLYPSENEKNAISLVNAFSVEKLSTAFFDEYTLHYKKFVDYLENSNFRKSVFDITHYPNATDKEKETANKPIRDFAKKMLGRIVFLYFVQKKGWLGASNTDYENGSDNFIYQLFEKSGANENFYHQWLSKLFFETLNKQRTDDNFTMPDGATVKIPYLNGGLFDPEEFDNELLTISPALFHSNDFEDVIFTDKLYKKNDPNHRGFLDFLNAFNFTVHEDSPEDHTVAVDPEMLGHIFENLLEDNKDKGAFYTPKEIVHYMCQESLIEYLNTHLNPKADAKTIKEVYNKQNTNLRIHANQYYDENYDDIQDFVKNKTVNEYILNRAANVNKYLDNVKICDPAIGSGAFPMGLLQEIFAIKELIAFETSSIWEPAKVKENIIQNSIYGVDIEKGAVDIARLRFWLSLLVDKKGTDKEKALPNLDYKIVVGNSLVSKFKEHYIHIDWNIKASDDYRKKIKDDLKELIDAKRIYFTIKKDKDKAQKDIRLKTLNLLESIITFDKKKYTNNININGSLFEQSSAEKKKIILNKQKIDEFDISLDEINVLKTNNEKLQFFDWFIDFAEILNPNFIDKKEKIGFDIMIGNPPYIKEYTNKSAFDGFKNSVYYQGKMDLWYGFSCLMIDNLKENGIQSFIAQNNWITSAGASKLRYKIMNDTEIKSFIDLGNYKVFKTAGIQTMIYVVQKKKYKVPYSLKYSLLLDEKLPEIKLNDFLNYNLQNEFAQKYIFEVNDEMISDRSFAFNTHEDDIILDLIEKKSNFKLKKEEIIQGIVGAPDNAFIISKDKKNNFSNNEKLFIKPYYTNSDGESSDSIIYLNAKNFNNKNIDDFPNFKKHFEKYKEDLIKAKIQYKTPNKKYYYLHRERDESFFIKGEKIICQIRASKGKFLFTMNEYYGSRALNIIKSNRVSNKYLSLLYNSQVINFWYKNRGAVQGNLMKYDIGTLLNIPLFVPNDVTKFTILVDYLLFLNQNSNINKLVSTYFEQIIDGMVYELYFPDLLKQHNRTIIEHLGELPVFTDNMSDNQKMEIITTVFDRLNDKNHPVRVNLEKMKTIEEIRIIEGIKE